MRGSNKPRVLTLVRVCLTLPPVLALLTSCLEQVQSPRSATGALSNFYLHLYAGELDDARAYMAPGLVDLSPELDRKIQEASEQLRLYEIGKQKGTEQDLNGGEKQVTIPGRVRPRSESGTPNASPDGGWVEIDIITARMVERGPGWRILDFELKCCAPIPP